MKDKTQAHRTCACPQQKQDVFIAGQTPFLFATFSLGAAKKKLILFTKKNFKLQQESCRDGFAQSTLEKRGRLNPFNEHEVQLLDPQAIF